MSGDERGLSMVELLIAGALMLIVGTGAVGFIHSQSLAMQTGAGQLDLDDTARGVIEFLSREIRMAGYNPRCLSPSPVRGIVEASAHALRIQFDRNENGVLDASSDAQEDVRYFHHEDSGTLRRTAGDQTSVLARNVSASGFQLRYFAADGTELTGTGDAALSDLQRAAVHEVTMLFVPARRPDARVAQSLEAPLWTGVALRNREFPCQ